MKNLGLSKYAALVSKTFSNCAKLHFNIIPESWNVHHEIPLYKSKYNKGLSLALIYDYQSASLDIGLGKRIRFDSYLTLQVSGSNVILTKSDGKQLTYTLKKEETEDTYVIKTYNCDESTTYITMSQSQYGVNVVLHFKNRDLINFKEINDIFVPTSFVKRNGDTMTLSYDLSGKIVSIENSSEKQEKITFDYGTNEYVLVQAFKENKNNVFEEVKAIKLFKNTTGTFLGYLSQIIILPTASSTTILKNFTFTQSANGSGLQTYKVIDNVSNLSCEYQVTPTGAPSCYKDEKGRTTLFAADSQYCVSMTNYRGKTLRFHTDEKARLMSVQDNEKKVVSFKQYDELNNETISSNMISFDPNKNGKVLSFSSETRNTLLTKQEGTTPNFLSEFYPTNKCFNLYFSGEGGKYIQLYEIIGNKFEVFSLGVWSKINSYSSLDVKLKVNLYFTNNSTFNTNEVKAKHSMYINTKETTADYEYHVLSTFAPINFKFIFVEFVQEGIGSLNVDIISDFYKKGLATMKEYDEKGNEISSLQSNTVSEVIYNGDNSVASTRLAKYEYDDYGNVSTITDAFGKVEKFEYDEANNLVKHIVFDSNNEIVSTKTYIDEEVIGSEESEIEVEVDYQYDDVYNKVKDIKKYDSSGNYVHESYQYNGENYDLLKKKTYSKNGLLDKSVIEYDYDSKNNLKIVKHNSTNCKYEFMYDTYNRMVGFKVNDNTYITNTYDTYNNLPTDLLKAVQFGNKDLFEYSYDGYDRMVGVSYKESASSAAVLLFSYNYDELDNIISIVDHLTNTTYVFEYDENKVITSMYYKYNNEESKKLSVTLIKDSNEETTIKRVIAPDKTLDFTTQSIYKSLNNDFATYKQTIRNNNNLLCMFDEFAAVYKNSETGEETTKIEQYAKLINYNKNKIYTSTVGEVDDERYKKDGFLTYYRSGMSSSTITFDFSEDSPLSTEQSIAFNVQITESIGSSYLLRLSDETNVLKIVANATGQLFVKENDSTVLQTDVETENDSYHFVCLTYNTVNKTVTLKVDDKTYNATLNVSFSNFIKLYLMDGIVCSLTNIIIPINGVISDDDYGKYKDSFNYLLTLNESRKNEEGNIIKASSKRFIEDLQYGFIPLNNGTSGIVNNEKFEPVIDEVIDLPCICSKNSEFIYNDKIKRSAYLALGQMLAYELGQCDSGGLSINFNRMFINNENVLFDIVDSDNKHITLSICDSKFKLKVDNTELLSNTISSLTVCNSWNNITLTWNKLVVSESLDYQSYSFNVYMDGQSVISQIIDVSTSFEELTVFVGRNNDETSKSGNCFNGLLESLVIIDSTSSLDIIALLNKTGMVNMVSHEYNTLNLLTKTIVYDNNVEVLKNMLTYVTQESSEEERTKLLPQVFQETINSDMYRYEYDVRGNVTKIIKNGLVQHTYSYDELGRLHIEDNNVIYYDENGNITQVKENDSTIIQQFTYSSTYKDLLTSVNGVTITYDETTLNPISIGNDITLSFKGRDLSEYIDVTNNIHNKYYYDHNGNRVLKEEYDSSNNLVKSTRYYYNDKGKIIHQDDGTYKLTFLYDELEQLYGFIYNNNRYYYVKNVLGNILAIIDNNKRKVVEYSYNAWGEVTSTGGTLAHINPFRYKSYYYDSDIKMYYCKSRYYIPSWKRWLNADSPKYLDNKDTNNLNLFVYCFSNPVMLLDNLGTYPVKLVNYLDKTKYFVNHIDGGYVSSNQIIEGTTDVFWRISNKISTFQYDVGIIIDEKAKEEKEVRKKNIEKFIDWMSSLFRDKKGNPIVIETNEDRHTWGTATEVIPNVNSSSYLKGMAGNGFNATFSNLDEWWR